MPDNWDAKPLKARLEIARKKAEKGAERGLRLGANHLLRVSRKLAPIEEGTLGRSGKVSVDNGGSTKKAAVSFNTVYAVRQHEELDWNHDPGRQAKYLEQPMNTEAGTIAALVGSTVKKEMES